MTVQKLKHSSETAMVENYADPHVKQAIQDLFDTLKHMQQELDRTNPGKGGGVGLASRQIEYPYEPIFGRRF